MQKKEIKQSDFNYHFIQNGCIIFPENYALYLKRIPRSIYNPSLKSIRYDNRKL